MKLYRSASANFLYWFATRSFRVGTLIVLKLIKWAIILNPKRTIFHNSFQNIASSTGILPPNTYDKKKFSYLAFSNKNISAPNKFTLLANAKPIKLNLPYVVNNDFVIDPKHECEANIPQTYLAKIIDAKVFAKTDLIIANNTIFYDEIVKKDVKTNALMSHCIVNLTKKNATIKIPKTKPIKISTGIHLAKDYSLNYFHWLVEALPRLSITSNVDKNVPLLVDNNLPEQHYEALDILNFNNRKIIKLDIDQSYIVEKLYYPSALSEFRDNYDKPIHYKDYAYSPKAINFVRDNVLKKLQKHDSKPYRKIFVSRKSSDYRQLLNSEEIEQCLIDRGFEIVFPEKLSFSAQVAIFSQAKIIIGQSGAGMTNMMFSHSDCKVIMLLSDVRVNLHIFNALALAANIDLKFFIGKHIPLKRNKLHADFHVDTEQLLRYLDTINN